MTQSHPANLRYMDAGRSIKFTRCICYVTQKSTLCDYPNSNSSDQSIQELFDLIIKLYYASVHDYADMQALYES